MGATYIITKGPFGYVRNPLYFGNILMYFGFGIMANTPIFALVGLVYFLFQYSLIVSLEEETLLNKFPEEYIEYYKEVPRFIPALKQYKGGTHPQPEISWYNGWKSERRTMQAIGLVILLLLALWYFRSL